MSDAIKTLAETVKAARIAEDKRWREQKDVDFHSPEWESLVQAYEKAVRARQDAEFQLTNLALLDVFGTISFT